MKPVRQFFQGIALSSGWLMIFAAFAVAEARAQGSSTGAQAMASVAMNHEQRQLEVERMRQSLEKSPPNSPDALRPYLEGKPEELRRDLYAELWRTRAEPSKWPGRTLTNCVPIVEFMLGRLPEETPMLRGQLLKWLQDFLPEDFSTAAIASLNALPWTDEYAPEVIRILGIAGSTEAISRLKAQVKSHSLSESPPIGYHHSNTWAALLALARMGDEEALAEVLRRTRQEPDIIVRATILFRDLGYTRQPQAFDVLEVYLNSDERLPSVRRDTDPGRLEAALAAAVFSKYIQDFPIAETDFNEQQVQQARAWVNAQDNWRFK
jgi:hypothetical protein